MKTPTQTPGRRPGSSSPKHSFKSPGKKFSYTELFLEGVVSPTYSGFSLIPIKPLGKEPLIQWKDYQVEMYRGDFPRDANIAMITGWGPPNLVTL